MGGGLPPYSRNVWYSCSLWSLLVAIFVRLCGLNLMGWVVGLLYIFGPENEAMYVPTVSLYFYSAVYVYCCMLAYNQVFNYQYQ